MIISRSVLLRMRNVSDKSCRENQNTHFVFSNFFFENRAVYQTEISVALQILAECTIRCLCLILYDIGKWQQIFVNTVWYNIWTQTVEECDTWGFVSFGMWRRVVWWVLPDFSKNDSVCLLQADGPSSTMLDPEEEGITIFRNIRSYSSHPQRYRCENLKCRSFHYLLHATARTGMRDEAFLQIFAASVRLPCVCVCMCVCVCVFKVANMASERNL